MNGQGTIFSRSADGTTFTPMAKIANLTAPSVARESSEQSYIDDPGGWKEFEPGMKDGGEVELTLKWVPGDAAQGELKADLDANTNFYYRITYPDGSTDEFMGHITEWGKELSKADTIMRKVKFKVSGEVTETNAP